MGRSVGIAASAGEQPPLNGRLQARSCRFRRRRRPARVDRKETCALAGKLLLSVRKRPPERDLSRPVTYLAGQITSPAGGRSVAQAPEVAALSPRPFRRGQFKAKVPISLKRNAKPNAKGDSLTDSELLRRRAVNAWHGSNADKDGRNAMPRRSVMLAISVGLSLGTAPALAADAAKEISTAAAHAGMAAASDTPKMVRAHLHHVLNCLEGPAGADFDASAVNPCKDQGAGAIPDSAPEKRAALETAAALARKAIGEDDASKAKAMAAEIQSSLRK